MKPRSQKVESERRSVLQAMTPRLQPRGLEMSMSGASC
jgi:hypothetical protein